MKMIFNFEKKIQDIAFQFANSSISFYNFQEGDIHIISNVDDVIILASFGEIPIERDSTNYIFRKTERLIHFLSCMYAQPDI